MKFAFTLVSALAIASVASAADTPAPKTLGNNVADVARAFAQSTLQATKAAVQRPKNGKKQKKPAYLPNTYMVEFAAQKAPTDPLSHIKSFLANRNQTKYNDKTIKQRTNIRSKLFTGFSFTLDADHDAADLQDIPDVVQVFPVRINRRPQVIKGNIQKKNEFPLNDITPHAMTGVETVHKSGHYGKGVKVAVIDTGVYWKHPALGGCFGPGCKIAFGADLVGDDYDADTNPVPVPDDDPMDNCSDSSHGTHVSGIIGANATGINVPGFTPAMPFLGVAPQATLGHYRIFGCNGNNGDDILAKAIYRAFEDGADVISISVGEAGVVADESVSPIAIERVSRAGVHIVVSAGNDGGGGLYTVGDPAFTPSAYAVASWQNHAILSPVILDEKNASYPFVQASEGGAWKNEKLQIVLADDNDGCAKQKYDTAGKVLLVHYNSQCGSNAICGAAAAQNATGCLLYNVGSIRGNAAVPGASLADDVAQRLIAAVKANPKQLFAFTDKKQLVNSADAATASDFSAYGPDAELNLKPDIAGVGGNIYSTVSQHAAETAQQGDAYQYMSGTSMACPYISGTIALFIEQRGHLSVPRTKAYLQNAAVITKLHNSSLIENPVRQGAGLVDIAASLSGSTIITPSALALNDTIRTKKSYTINIKNGGKNTITYKLDHVAAALATGQEAGNDMPIPKIAYSDKAAKVTINPSTIRLGPGRSQDITLKFTQPKVDTNLLPIYGGYIRATPSDGSAVVSVPYMGMAGDFSKAKMLSEINPTPNSLTNGIYLNGTKITAGTTLNATQGIDVQLVLAHATRVVFVDVIAASSGLPGFKPSLGVLVPVPSTPSNTPYSFTVAAYRTNQPRNVENEGQGNRKSYPIPWFGNVTLSPASGAADTPRQHGKNDLVYKLPAGQYQVRFTALKHFGDVSKPGDFEVTTSPAFKLVY